MRFEFHDGKRRDVFGGSLLKNSHAKVARPLDSKFPIHLVLRSNFSAMRTPQNFGPVNKVVKAQCSKHGVDLFEYANVGNHLHLVIKIGSRARWAAFIRELAGAIAVIAGGKGAKFWRQRPFTRIVRGWRKPFAAVKLYVNMNRAEADGHIDRKVTKTLRDYRAIFETG